MYSLGIVLFEMCHEPFSTGMERIQSILSLRKDATLFLKDSNISENMKNIIICMLQSDPLKRPEASELQSSPYMPPRIQLDKSYFEEVLTAITTPHSEASRRVVSALFEKKENTATLADFYYDQDFHNSIIKTYKLDGRNANIQSNLVNNQNTNHNHNSNFKKVMSYQDVLTTISKTDSMVLLPSQVQESYEKIAETVFSCHGAAEFSPSPLTPRDPFIKETITSGLTLHSSKSSWNLIQEYDENILSQSINDNNNNPVEIMTKDGTILTLPTNLVTLYARAVARIKFSDVTHYHIDNVYKEIPEIQQINGNNSTIGDKHPIIGLEAVYDIIREDSPLKSSTSMQQTNSLAFNRRTVTGEKKAFIEAEVITVAADLADKIDPKYIIGQRYVRLGDSKLGNAILDLCAVPYPRTKILKVLSIITDTAIVAHKRKTISPQSLFHRAENLIKSTGLPEDVQRALRPFIKIISTITNPCQVIYALDHVIF